MMVVLIVDRLIVPPAPGQGNSVSPKSALNLPLIDPDPVAP